MGASAQTRYKLELECGHYLWFLKPLPDLEEILYCRYCEAYKHQAIKDAKYGESYQDDWLSQREGSGYIGTCLMDGKEKGSLCNHQVKRGNWYDLRNDIERHQLREHSSLFKDLQFEEVTRDVTSKRKTEPDF